MQKTKRKNGTVVWTFRWRETAGGSRVRRKKIVGTLAELPTRKAAEQAVSQLRTTINTEVVSPETVNDLIAHYQVHELTPERKAFSSMETERIMLRKYIGPNWGESRLSEVRTIKVEEWLKLLELAPASRAKVKAVFRQIYTHAIRYEWLTFNPISKVRTSQKRVREKDVLEPAEFQALLEQLTVRDNAMVMLAASAGLRRSELVALRWSDIDTVKMEVSITRAFVRSRMGGTKTDSSSRPVPLHPLVLEALTRWRQEAPFAENADFVFASVRLNGAKPLSPDTLCKKRIKPAVKRAGIEKQIGWHNFRHSLATWLGQTGADVKTRQDLMRHSTSKMTLDVYTHGVSAARKEANDSVVEIMLRKRKEEMDPSGPLRNKSAV